MTIAYDCATCSPRACAKGAACTPITQATLRHARRADLPITVRLCLGHDLLFAKHADAPVTTLAGKDRALQQHPLAGWRAQAEGGR